MSDVRRSMWYQALAVWLSALLVLGLASTVLAQAQETDVPTEVSYDVDRQDASGEVDEVLNGRQHLLAQTLRIDDCHSYTVAVAYNDDAQIPKGSSLCVLQPTFKDNEVEQDIDDETAQDYAKQTEKALKLGENDRIVALEYLAVTIEADGQPIQPASDVDVTIETNATSPAQSSFVEVVPMVDAQAADDTAASDEDRIVPSNLTEDRADEVAKLRFTARHLGTFALVHVATSQDVWSEAGLVVSLLLPRQGVTAVVMDAAPPEMPEGMEALACYSVQVEPKPAYGTTLYLEARRIGEDSEDCMDGVAGYRVSETDTTPYTSLFGPGGTSEPTPFNARNERLLFVRDSGYRSVKLNLSDVTVEGMMPEGTRGIARDVTQSFEGSGRLKDGLDEDLAAKVEEGACEVKALAAYDISLEANGAEYQPDEGHPLTVTIANDAITQDKDLQLWHVLDDGSVEVIEDFSLSDGLITFEALSFSTYLLVQQSEAEPVSLSTYFDIRASAKTYARTSRVTFVDEDKNPLMGAVTGTQRVAYTGGGAESNETNTIDLYSFADKLSPAIADEYEFSRVYMSLSASNQKDFRYIQVGDGTAIGDSASIYRAYFNLKGISQNAKGQDYHGTWYQLGFSGKMDDVFIEYYHVANASFYAIDTRNDPVVGAEFSLYVDSACYTPLEYKNKEVKAASDRNGLVSFGKIPRGTYYMKETVIPEGYKKSTNIYPVAVDGTTTINDVIHEDDDGSVIIADVLRMKLTKKWDDDRGHENDSVTLTVYAHGQAVNSATLNAQNDWTTTIEGLDPNEPYMVSETSVISGETDVTNNWMPEITVTELETRAEYYKADDFKKGKQYLALTKTSSGTRALSGGNGLTTTPLEVSEDGTQIAGTVTNEMLWSVDEVTKDGVIALKNVASGKYLDKGSAWTLNPEYPVPLYVRHINDEGHVKFYHRPNLNNATSNYLYVWYATEYKKEGTVDNYSTYADKAASFDIYRKVNVRSVDVTISNKTTRYPVQIRNLTYPNNTPLPNMTFDLYTKEVYEASTQGVPLMSTLTAGEDGFLRDGNGVKLELGAGTYYLCQTGDLQDEGYVPLTPLRFTITRGGALKVAQDDQDIAGFAYSTTIVDGATTFPVLQVPNWKSSVVEVTLAVEGSLADPMRPFEFTLRLPQGISQLKAKVNDQSVTLSAENSTFALAHGQKLVLEDAPATVDYVIAQASDCVAQGSGEGEGKYRTTAQAESEGNVTVTLNAEDRREVTLSSLRGTSTKPACVTITNTLESGDVPATGLADNAGIWGGLVASSLGALALLLLRRGRRRPKHAR